MVITLRFLMAHMVAARKRQRDKQAGIPARRLSWPTVVLEDGSQRYKMTHGGERFR